ncbi:Peptidase inhibitor 16, partial [Clonorchis sinensis]
MQTDGTNRLHKFSAIDFTFQETRSGFTRKHTACMPHHKIIPHPLYTLKASDPNKEDYLSRHNMYRTMMWQGKVLGQPPASVLPNLTWSERLEKEAKLEAEMCVSAVKGTILPGEARTESKDVNLDSVKRWFDQHVHYKYGLYPPENPDQVSGYTQLVWARTQTVGCYRAYCNNFWTRFTWEAKIYNTVCRYWPPGNVDKELPYEQTQQMSAPAKSRKKDKKRSKDKKEVHPIGDTPANPEEQGWLDQHNTYRAMLLNGQIPGQPIPLKMPNLTWSSQLTEVARKAAKLACSGTHDADGLLAVSRYGIYDFLSHWFEEHRTYTYGRYPPNNAVDNMGYTQIIWASTKQVGCHKEFCEKYWTGATWDHNVYSMMCYYSPKGNNNNHYPYQTPETVKELKREKDRAKKLDDERKAKINRFKVPGLPPKLKNPHDFLHLHDESDLTRIWGAVNDLEEQVNSKNAAPVLYSP